VKKLRAFGNNIAAGTDEIGSGSSTSDGGSGSGSGGGSVALTKAGKMREELMKKRIKVLRKILKEEHNHG